MSVAAPQSYVTIPACEKHTPYEPSWSWKEATKAEIDKNTETMRLQALESMHQKLKSRPVTDSTGRTELETDYRNFVNSIKATAQSQFIALLKQEKDAIQWASNEGGISDSFIREQQTIMDTVQHKKADGAASGAGAHAGAASTAGPSHVTKAAPKSPTTSRTKAAATPATPSAPPSRTVLSPTNERAKITTTPRNVTSPKPAPTATPKTPGNRAQGPQNFTSPPISAKPSRDANTNTNTTTTNGPSTKAAGPSVRSPSATWQNRAQANAVTPSRVVATPAKKDTPTAAAKSGVKSPVPGPSSGPAAAVRDRRLSVAAGPSNANTNGTPPKSSSNAVSRPGAEKMNGNTGLVVGTTSAAAAKPAPEFWQPTVSRDQASPTTRRAQVLPSAAPKQANGVTGTPKQAVSAPPVAQKGKAAVKEEVPSVVRQDKTKADEQRAKQSDPATQKDVEQRRKKEAEQRKFQEEEERRRASAADAAKKNGKGASTTTNTKEPPSKPTQNQNGSAQGSKQAGPAPPLAGPSTSQYDTTTTSYEYESGSNDDDNDEEDDEEEGNEGSSANDYSGPHLETDDPIADELEHDIQFEWYKAHVQEQKIFEFHWEAARADVDLTRELQRLRKSGWFTREEEARRVEEHGVKMTALKEAKEVERRQLVNEERVRRRTQMPPRPVNGFSSPSPPLAAQVFMNGSSASASSSPAAAQTSLKGTSPASSPQTLRSSSSPQASTSNSLRDIKSPPAVASHTLPAPGQSQRPPSPPKVDPTQVNLPNSPAKQAIHTPKMTNTNNNNTNTSPRPVTLEEVEDEDARRPQPGPIKKGVVNGVPASPPSKTMGQEAPSSLQQLQSQNEAPLIFSLAPTNDAKTPPPAINGHVPNQPPAKPVSAQPQAQAQSKDKQNWDPTDMTSPAYWDALLSDGDAEPVVQTKQPTASTSPKASVKTPAPAPVPSTSSTAPQTAGPADPQRQKRLSHGDTQGRKVLGHVDNEQEMQAELERLEAEKRAVAASERARKKQFEEEQQRTKEERFRKQQREYNERLAVEEREKGRAQNGQRQR